MNNIKELLQRYLDDHASDRERRELMELYHEGKLDDVVVEEMMKEIFDERSRQDMHPEHAKEMLAQILLHEQEAGIVPIRKNLSWVWKSAATVLILAIAGMWWVHTEDTAPQQTAGSEIKEDALFLFSDLQNKYVQLPDGSTAILNAGSELSYRGSYGDSLREVTLTGEAFFEVKADAGKPFVVRSGEITTKVLGTAFNVRAYPRTTEIIVTVTKGSVQVYGDERVLDVVTPDQQIAVNTATRQFTKVRVDAVAALDWTNKFLILDHVTLEEAATIIAKKYNVKIVLANEGLKRCRVMATFLKDESLEHVLSVVSAINGTEYAIKEDGNVVIDGKGCH